MEIVEFEGIEVTIARLSLTRAQRWESSAATGVWCGVLAEGIVETSGPAQEGTWKPKTAINYCIDEPLTIGHHAPEACQLSAVFMRIPLASVDAVVGNDTGGLLTRPQNEFRSWRDHRAASALAWQMLGCPLSGAARRLYLCGKALEILSVVTQGAGADTRGAEDLAATSSELERIHAARALLLASLSDPPSVPRLARSVGMNAHRLGALFKATFGATVYAYVKAARLDHARVLLESGEVTVAQAAYGCGYHPAHFSTEFRKRFGFPPSAVTGRTRLPSA